MTTLTSLDRCKSLHAGQAQLGFFGGSGNFGKFEREVVTYQFQGKVTFWAFFGKNHQLISIPPTISYFFIFLIAFNC